MRKFPILSGFAPRGIAHSATPMIPPRLTSALLALSAVATLRAAPPVAQPDSATMHRGQKVRLAVLANDTGTVTATTVAIVQPPLFGTAAPDSAGRILYTHATGGPAGDSFTYRVSGPGGTSAPATVSIVFSNALRIANSTFHVPATPPPLAVQLTPVLTGLSQPVCLASPPGDALRLYFCEKAGLLRMIPDITAATPAVSTFLNLPALLATRGEALSTDSEQGLLSVAFHPNYAVNHFFYVAYSVSSGGTVYERVSRFTATSATAANPASELVLLEQPDDAGNHNGGDLHFGPDGYLYYSTGDEGEQNDYLENSQRIDKDFFSAILRLDVDKRPGNLEPNAHPNPADYPSSPPADSVKRDAGIARYSVPADNPWVGATSFNGEAVSAAHVRSEFWAVGMRNPWRFSFDALTGELWCGDVGSGSWEEVDVVTRGMNAGWAFREGLHDGPNAPPPGFSGSDPLYEYPHGGGDPNFAGYSITGGVVYRGARFPSLAGAYIFGDYVTGNIWSLVRNGANPPTVVRLAGQSGVSAFGTDPSNGDVLLANLNGSIQRLAVVTVSGTYPATLSATNLFADLTDLAPAPGLLPYPVNLPFWSDYAVKRRWFTVPDGASTMAWSRDGAWTFPSGTIWVKHFDLETTRGSSTAVKKRLETRLIVKNATGAYGVSYRWNDAGTDAVLVPEGGADFDVPITVSGAAYTQHWRIPNRAECLACHTPQAGYALSFNTRQLNLASIDANFAGNEIDVLRAGGCFSNTPASVNLLPRHLRPEETAYPAEARVRSYLAVNCAYCHQAGGTGAPAAWDGRPELALDLTGLLNGVAANNGGVSANKLVVPGDTLHSIVLSRMAANGFTRMPPFASNELDAENLALVAGWIASLPPVRQNYAGWRLAQFGSSTSAAGDPAFDADSDGVSNRLEFLALTRPLDGASFIAPQLARTGGSVTVGLSIPANRSFQIETSADLATWALWDVPENNGLARPGGAASLTGPASGAKRFFRARLWEN